MAVDIGRSFKGLTGCVAEALRGRRRSIMPALPTGMKSLPSVSTGGAGRLQLLPQPRFQVRAIICFSRRSPNNAIILALEKQ